MSHRLLRPMRCVCTASERLVRSSLKPPNPILRSRISSARSQPHNHAYSTSSISPSARRRISLTLVVLVGSTISATLSATSRRNRLQLDAPPTNRDVPTAGAKVEITGKVHPSNVEEVPTGTSTIPLFPCRIWLPRSGSSPDEGSSPALPAGIGAAQEEEEYQLLGLGVRKVSLFKIQVYVVGLYVAKSDIGRLQEELVKASVGSGASTLVQGEKQELKKNLLDGEGSTMIWEEVLKEGGVRSAVRIVPTRNTNFSHLRDGWIRGIDMRGKGKEFEDEGFKAAVTDFKGMLGGRGSVAKGKVLLLGRGADGALKGWVEEEQAAGDAGQAVAGTPGQEHMALLGNLKDERVSRLVWLGYLAGENVASDQARESIVDGVMDIVERPIGTVETQVL